MSAPDEVLAYLRRLAWPGVAAAVRLPASRSPVIAAGMLFTAALWAVMQYGIWRAVDATAAREGPT